MTSVGPARTQRPEVVLRPMEAGEEHAAAGVHLDARSWAVETGMMPPPAHPRSDAGRWFTHNVAPHREVWVAEADERLVGVLVLDAAFVDQLCVLPAYAGRGIGSALLQLATALRPDGFGLWVFEVNARARRLYERCGLVPVERGDGSGNDEGAPDVRYAWHPGD